MSVDLKILLEILFSEEQLWIEFERHHADSTTRGIDRRNGADFSSVAATEISAISRKCLAGTYRFTPYLETLKVKDHKSVPRRIGLPAIRDRIVLSQLNKLLRAAFREESRSPLASNYIKRVASELKMWDPTSTWTAGCDIKRFYDSLDRSRLITLLQKRLGAGSALQLIKSAICTPIVPSAFRRLDLSKYSEERGVPQGLAISNALAAIYLYDVDRAMQSLPVSYYRFVDDVLLIGGEDQTKRAQRSFAARVRARGLAVHKLGDKKSHHLPLGVPFQYLGYLFEMPKVSVRASTVERLIGSLAAQIADYKHNHKRIVERKSYLTEEMYRQVFFEELNERIGGAISQGKKYGWVAYFSEINDLSVLHRIDAIVASLLSRTPNLQEFAGKTKRYARAYFEMKHRPYGGYVRNYDEIVTPAQMIRFLTFRGKIGEGERLSEEQIKSRFVSYRDRQLGLMLADETEAY